VLKIGCRNIEDRLANRIKDYEYMVSLWGEFERNLIQIDDVSLGTIKIAGVKIPVLQEVIFSVKDY